MFKMIAGIALCAACSVSHAALNIQSWTLPNGARVLFVENHTIPILDLSVDFDAGSRRDPIGKSGVAALTNAMLARGIRAGQTPNEPTLTEAQISDAFADTAALRGARLDDDRSGITLRALVSEREIAVPLVGRLLAEPSFPQEFFVRDQARTIAAIKESLTQPEAIADKAFARLLYGDHPYGQHLTVESVSAIARDDLLAFHTMHYVANRAIVALIGDVTREQADQIALELTRRLPQGAALPAVPAVPVAQGVEERIPHQASQAHILIGMPAMARHDPDHFALTVGNYVLGGGGFASRLMQEIREKRGLTYGVGSYFNPMAQAGPFQIGLQTKKEQANDALKVARDALAEFLRDGLTAAELKGAKDNLIGGFSLRIDSNKKILENIAAIGFYQLPLDYLATWTEKVAAVSATQIKDAFNRKLQMDKLSVVVVGADK